MKETISYNGTIVVCTSKIEINFENGANGVGELSVGKEYEEALIKIRNIPLDVLSTAVHLIREQRWSQNHIDLNEVLVNAAQQQGEPQK